MSRTSIFSAFIHGACLSGSLCLSLLILLQDSDGKHITEPTVTGGMPRYAGDKLRNDKETLHCASLSKLVLLFQFSSQDLFPLSLQNPKILQPSFASDQKRATCGTDQKQYEVEIMPACFHALSARGFWLVQRPCIETLH